jgi:hypothetical protein
MSFDGKSRRLRERIKLALPVRVHGRESADHEWVEMSRLIDVTPFGAGFALTHPTEPGRMLHLTMPLPRQLRCFDHVEDQYRVWALVRWLMVPPRPLWQRGVEQPPFVVGVAFTGKHPPPSYLQDPAARYEADTQTGAENLWEVRPLDEERAAAAAGARSQETRLQMALGVRVEVFDVRGGLEASEETVTENISRRGASVWTTLRVARGRFVRVTSLDGGFAVVAAVRAARTGPDGIPRLHLEFIDRQWPLEGVE